MNIESSNNTRWYHGIKRYQWLVLVIAALGWTFDVFEGQIFVASMNEAMPSLISDDVASLPADEIKGRIAVYNNVAFAAFLVGGSLGGILFGMLSDRIGRKKTMSLTILFYSLFTCLSAFSQQWWHLAGLRFLVAMGVGGEWAVASSLVAEVFPNRARAHVGSIFHAFGALGAYLAVAAGTFLIGNAAVHAWSQGPAMHWVSQIMDPASLPWRLGFALGVLPALLIVWIRMSLREPESWKAAREKSREDPQQQMGNIRDLFRGDLLRRTLVGITLSAIGMATFWGTYIYGKDAFLQAVERREAANTVVATPDDAAQLTPGLATGEETAEDAAKKASMKRWEMLGFFLITTGLLIGQVAFGPVCQIAGRRRAFAIYHIGGLVSALVVFQYLQGVTALMIALPCFGFLTAGMHAGYAVYFPELYPTRLRGTGAGFCFNAGRLLAAPVLLAVGGIQYFGVGLLDAASLLSLLYLGGLVILVFAPETKGQELPT